METAELDTLGEKFAELVQAKFAQAKVEWMIEKLDDGSNKICFVIAVAAKAATAGGPDTNYPPGRQ